jgi:hypothetical protein
MPGQAQIVLNLVEVRHEDGGDRIFLSLERAGGQGRVEIGEGQGLHVGSDGLEARDHHSGLRHAEFEVLEVFRPVNRPVEGREVAQAIFAPAKTDNALRLEPRQRRFADLTVHHAAGVGKVAKQEGDVEDAEFGRDGSEDRGRGESRVERAGADVLHHFQLAARRAGWVKLDPQPAAAIALDVSGELERAGAKLRFSRVDDAHPKHLRRDGGPRAADVGKAKRRHGCGGTCEETPSSHHVAHFFPFADR